MGEVKLLFLVKFKDELTEKQIEEFIEAYKKMVDAVKPLKHVQYGKDLGSTSYGQGFTHVFQCTFESKEGIAEFIAHPAHVEFSQTQGAAKMDKFIVIDYLPTQYP